MSVCKLHPLSTGYLSLGIYLAISVITCSTASSTALLALRFPRPFPVMARDFRRNLQSLPENLEHEIATCSGALLSCLCRSSQYCLERWDFFDLFAYRFLHQASLLVGRYFLSAYSTRDFQKWHNSQLPWKICEVERKAYESEFSWFAQSSVACITRFSPPNFRRHAPPSINDNSSITRKRKKTRYSRLQNRLRFILM